LHIFDLSKYISPVLVEKPQRDESLFFNLNGGFCRREKGSMREEQVEKC